jgi:hypothetical protein
MDIEQRVIAQGIDSWEAEMTYHGITFMVTAQLEDWRDPPMWWMEVLQQTSSWSVQTLYGAYYPTLEVVIHDAHDAIRTIIKDRSAAT